MLIVGLIMLGYITTQYCIKWAWFYYNIFVWYIMDKQIVLKVRYDEVQQQYIDHNGETYNTIQDVIDANVELFVYESVILELTEEWLKNPPKNITFYTLINWRYE